jgi:CheY-like chemotaxis protein
MSSIRLVMMASSGLRGDAARVGGIGFAAYLPKPPKAGMLLSCLMELQSAAGAGDPGTAGLITAHSLCEQARPGLDILVVDDNAMNCRLAALILEKAGHRIDVVHDGRAAIDAVAATPYDLVLMDVQMPDIDGLEATRRIRQLGVDHASHVPVIAITANALQGDDQRCLDAGMDDYVTKPIDRARLLGKVIQWGYRAVG